MIRNKIWYNLVNSKFKCYYISYLIDKLQRRSLYINLFLAIVSLSSVSAWVIWKELPWLWALIIAASNIIVAIKPYLLYDKTIKEFNEKLLLLEGIEIEYEKLFFDLDNNKIEENNCSELFFSIYERQAKALRTSDDIRIGLYKDLKVKANQDTDRYIFNNYNTKSE